LRRLSESSVGHEDLRAQESQVITDLTGDGALDAVHGLLCVLWQVFLEVDACEAVNGLVTNRFVDISIDDSLDGASGTLVHPVEQLEITHIELRLVDVIMKRVLFRFIHSVVPDYLGV
jgi:hypothetical protein